MTSHSPARRAKRLQPTAGRRYIGRVSQKPRPDPPIVVLTDFGERDWFVGVMKGVIAGIAPERTVIDLCHEVPPGDVAAAALMLEAAGPYFPPGSVFCCVVDPGVGTERRVLLAEWQGRYYVGPDNGLLAGPGPEARYFAFELERHLELVARGIISTTFHGRDIFAPLAAHVSRGLSPARLGTEIFDPVVLHQARPEKKSDGGVRGRVQYVDRFGNLITNLRFAEIVGEFPAVASENWTLRVADRIIRGISVSYGGRAPGEYLVYVGSLGYLEIAINGGDAARLLSCAVGDEVELACAV